MSNAALPLKNGLSLLTKAQGAFLAAAIGDALGWPQEDRSRRVGKPENLLNAALPSDFQKWIKRVGSRFNLHEDVILAGEYSDDTQMLLCTARSLLQGEGWWDHLTKRELPTWSLYERGGGRSTKNAVRSWMTNKEPWSLSRKTEDRHDYFAAGGNGVAMRIIPHCLFYAGEEDFRLVARNILADGICTHGHPRALVGALAYGFAAWEAFRETEHLQYGTIIERILSSASSWSVLLSLETLCPSWRPAAERASQEHYERLWEETVAEMLGLLDLCQKAMKQGALPVDQEVLKQLGCFERERNGAGTIAAAAAIFLASRYAADPFNGLMEAAFSEGADTDTIASMTGGLLGAIKGEEWLGAHAGRVQDAPYLRSLAEWLVKKEKINVSPIASTKRVTKKELDKFLEKLESSHPGDSIVAPDGREAQISSSQPNRVRTKNVRVFSWKLITHDGQSLYAKKTSKNIEVNRNPKESKSVQNGTSDFFHRKTFQPVQTSRATIRLPVRNLGKSRLFYEKALGLVVTKVEKHCVNTEGGLMLVAMDAGPDTENLTKGFIMKSASLQFRTRSLMAIYNNISLLRGTIITSPSQIHGRQTFQCLDPDGNVIELIEAVEART